MTVQGPPCLVWRCQGGPWPCQSRLPSVATACRRWAARLGFHYQGFNGLFSYSAGGCLCEARLYGVIPLHLLESETLLKKSVGRRCELTDQMCSRRLTNVPFHYFSAAMVSVDCLLASFHINTLTLTSCAQPPLFSHSHTKKAN